jgi:hypothetical protein
MWCRPSPSSLDCNGVGVQVVDRLWKVKFDIFFCSNVQGVKWGLVVEIVGFVRVASCS